MTQRGAAKPESIEEGAAQRMLAAIVEASDDAIVTTSLEGAIQTWNRGAERLFGYGAGEAVGRPIAFLVPPAGLEEERRIEARTQAGELVEHVETVWMRRNGQPIHVSLTVSPLRDEAGAVVGAWQIVRDITERVRLERQTRELAAELDDLDRRKDEFLAMLSHELRNPLAPIANAVELLRLHQSHESSIEQQARSIIERQVALLSRLVDDLLDVSRLTTGRFRLRRKPVALEGIVERAIETVSAQVAKHEHQLTVSMPSPSPWLMGDSARLEQVVVNLLTNAVKYTEDCGRIAVAVERDNGTAVLRVRDSGKGISPELLPRIFDLFTQAERPLDRAEGGLGIGLSLVRRLVELHGGTVEATSTPGQGSEFTVRLPTIAAPGSGQSVRRSTPATRTAKRARVLVVDDNLDAADSLAMLLRAEGHEVRTVHDGRAAVRAAAEIEPDVVFLDLGLPGLDGFAVAKAIRGAPQLEDLLLVAMTGYGQEADRERSQLAGFDHHLVKPADFGRVRQILDTVAARPAP